MSLWSQFTTYLRVRVAAVLDRAEDPRETLDYAYAQQQELLVRVKQGVVEVATSKRLLEQQAQKLADRVPQAERQAAQAVAAGREDLARIALQRKQTALAELQSLESRLAEVAQEERRLGQAEQQLAVRVEEFRTHRVTLQARYTAAEAQTRVMEALTGVSKEFADLGLALGRAEERIERMQARAAAIDALIEGGSLTSPISGLDPVELELRKLAASDAVEQELLALRARFGTEPAVLPPAAQPARRREAD
jgi:phage shock protein A